MLLLLWNPRWYTAIHITHISSWISRTSEQLQVPSHHHSCNPANKLALIKQSTTVQIMEVVVGSTLKFEWRRKAYQIVRIPWMVLLHRSHRPAAVPRFLNKDKKAKVERATQLALTKLRDTWYITCTQVQVQMYSYM